MQSSILILDARFYEAVSEQLTQGARAVLDQAKVRVANRVVPGAFELPVALQMAVGSFDGYVVIGCLIRGQTSHYELIATATIQSLQQLAIKHKLALGLGLLTVENIEQAIQRASIQGKDAGGLAARACLKMIALRKDLSCSPGL